MGVRDIVTEASQEGSTLTDAGYGGHESLSDGVNCS